MLLSLSSDPADKKMNLIKVSFIIFKDIVNRLNPLAHLIEQAGGLQGGSTGFHGNFIPVQNHSI